MTEPTKVKESAERVLHYLDQRWPNFCSVPEVNAACHQSDVRKRVSELIRAGYDVEKERNGRFVNFRYTEGA